MRLLAQSIIGATPFRGVARAITLLGLFVATRLTLGSEAYISEILFNPPGVDAPNQYIELRGTPNQPLKPGTYFVAVEGQTNSNPGKVKNVFNLSGQSIGGNGFLVLLQKTNTYRPSANATLLIQTGDEPGWGSGGSSSVNHRGDDDATDLVHPSVTFFLIQTTNSPGVGSDIDSDDDGLPDSRGFASWNVLDSVGVLSDHGTGDCAYGLVNFRRNSAPGNRANALRGTVVPVGFTPSYVARQGNSTGWSAADWVAGDNLTGTAPDWALAAGTTLPASSAGLALNHVGSPNFGAPAIPGIVAVVVGRHLDLREGGPTASYTLGLNTVPAGPVVIQIDAGFALELSVDGGTTFDHSVTKVFSNDAPVNIRVRAIDDDVVDISPRHCLVRHSITQTSDPARYPASSLGPLVSVDVTENDTVLLNELKVNPPGTNDATLQYIEIKGQPNARLTNVYFLTVEGKAGKNPGTATTVIDLTAAQLGTNGLLSIVGPGAPYGLAAGPGVVVDPHLSHSTNGLKSDSVSFLLVSSPASIGELEDLDGGDNGILEELPNGTTIMDAVGWRDGSAKDVVYGGAMLCDIAQTPDAAIRFPTDTTPRSALAWCFGSLAGPSPATLDFDEGTLSPNFPVGMTLTPGGVNTVPPATTPLSALCGDTGDPTNPRASFRVFASASPDLGPVTVTASSSNPAVVPDGNLVLNPSDGDQWTMRIDPVGRGYATITVTVSQGEKSGRTSFDYAASSVSNRTTRFQTGKSDASCALALDADYMLEGDNEDQVIRLYSRHFSGPPLREYDMSEFLALGSQEHGEMNIEGSTRAGSRTFWIGAHSHNNLGAARTNRSRVFGADLSGTGTNTTLTYVGHYEFLKSDLIAWDSSNGHGKGTNYYGLAVSAGDRADPKADDGSGFNIEGLTMAPGDAQIGWIGFRAPLVPVTNRAKAFIVPVLNFSTLAVSRASSNAAVFGDPIELNLGCRGIRSIEASTNGVLIVAGPTGRATTGTLPKDFRLFTWSGNPKDLPQERSADLSGLLAEGVVELPPPPWTDSSLVQLVNDDGTTVFYGDGIDAKHLRYQEFRKSRSVWVNLGSAVITRPCIRSLELADDQLILRWCSVPGRVYRIQMSTDLGQPVWDEVGGDVVATDSVCSMAIPLPPENRVFYRVIVR